MISGRGHADTVRFLMRYYDTHKSVEETVKALKEELPQVIQDSFRAAIRDAVVNLFQNPENVVKGQ